MSNHLNTPAFGPLQGVRVVFSAIEIAGPFSAQMLAEWGAEVIWIEHTAYPDTIRVQPNYPELSRRNLHALSLNIFSEQGRDVFLKLMETTDVFIEASKGPAFARRGITDELLWQHNPKLVIAHLSGFGQYGDDAYTHLPAYNTITQAFSGYLIQNGDKDQPIPAFPYTADYIAGFTVTSSVLAALYNVQRTGQGESIDVAMYEAILRVGQYYMMDHFNGGEMCPRMIRGKDPIYAGCGLYTCSDGYIVTEIVGSYQIEQIFTLIGLEGLLHSEAIPTGTQLIARSCEHAEIFETHLDRFFGERSVKEVLATLGEFNIAASKVLSVSELEGNPQYKARESIVEWKTRTGKTCKGPAIMPRFKNNPCKIWRAMPSQGMDSKTILLELGYKPEQIEHLVAQGVVKVDAEQ